MAKLPFVFFILDSIRVIHTTGFCFVGSGVSGHLGSFSKPTKIWRVFPGGFSGSMGQLINPLNFGTPEKASNRLFADGVNFDAPPSRMDCDEKQGSKLKPNGELVK